MIRVHNKHMSIPERPFEAERGDGLRPEDHGILSPDDEALIELISDHYVLNPDTMLASKAYEDDASIINTARKLHFWCGYAHEDRESWLAITAALHFAIFVGEVRKGREGIQPDLTEFKVRTKGEDAEAPRVIDEIATEYFRKHPSDEGIVRAFMNEIDPRDLHAHDVETVFGFVMDAIERGNWLANARNQLQDIGSGRHANDIDNKLIEAMHKDMYLDISSLCGELAAASEALLPAVIEAFTATSGRKPNLEDSRDISDLRLGVRDWFLDKWHRIEGAPMIGDTIVTNGKGIIMRMISNEEGMGGFECWRFDDSMQMRGTFKDFDIHSYLDKALLDLDEEKQVATGDSYIRPFGVHFVLRDVVVINGDASTMEDSLFYVPLHYPKMQVQLIRTALPADNKG